MNRALGREVHIGAIWRIRSVMQPLAASTVPACDIYRLNLRERGSTKLEK